MSDTRVAFVRDRVRSAVQADRRDGVAEGGALVFLGYLVRFAVGFAAGALVARALGPEGFGVYAVAGVAVAVGATIADFGLSTSATRQIAAELAKAPERAFVTAAAYVRLRLLGALIVLAAALLLGEPIAALLGLPDATGPRFVGLAGAAVLAAAANGVVSTIQHSLRRYRALLVGQACASLATLAGIAALFASDRLTVTSAMVVGVAGNMLSLGVGLALLPPAWRAALRRSTPLRGDESRRLGGFAAWLGVAGVFSILAAQLDLLLVGWLLDPEAVGFYGLALALAFKADVVNQVLRTALLPAVSGLAGDDAYTAHARRSLVRSTLVAVPLVLALPLAGPLITAVYGQEYAPAVGIFYALMAVVLLELLTGSVLLLAFPLNLPRWMAGAEAAATGVLLVAGAALIPLIGVYGAVVAKLLARSAAALIKGAAITLHVRAERRSASLSLREA